MVFGRRWQRINKDVPKRPVVINLSTNVQPAYTALIMFTSGSTDEIHKELEKIINSNGNVIPGNLPDLLRKFGDVFTDWEGILIDVQPAKPGIDLTSFRPVS